jgi:hypothetical protein
VFRQTCHFALYLHMLHEPSCKDFCSVCWDCIGYKHLYIHVLTFIEYSDKYVVLLAIHICYMIRSEPSCKHFSWVLRWSCMGAWDRSGYKDLYIHVLTFSEYANRDVPMLNIHTGYKKYSQSCAHGSFMLSIRVYF